MIIDTFQLFLGRKQQWLTSGLVLYVVMRIKHLETPVATVVKETNGSQSPLKHRSVDLISRSP